jgi:hypothetical protein
MDSDLEKLLHAEYDGSVFVQIGAGRRRRQRLRRSPGTSESMDHRPIRSQTLSVCTVLLCDWADDPSWRRPPLIESDRMAPMRPDGMSLREVRKRGSNPREPSRPDASAP